MQICTSAYERVRTFSFISGFSRYSLEMKIEQRYAIDRSVALGFLTFYRRLIYVAEIIANS